METAALERDFSRLILDHVDRVSTRLSFNERSEDDGIALELLSIRFREILSSKYMADEQHVNSHSALFKSVPPLEYFLLRMVEDLMSEESPRRQILEKTIDRIVEDAYEARIISPLLMMICQLGTCDFTLNHSFNAGKLYRMKSNLDLLNYKGVRTFFKHLYEHMAAVPTELSPEQRELLTPVLELLLYIMKRDSNVIPALFIATEINNMIRQKTFMFARVMESATHTENTFRPLAELCYATARTYLFPIPAHPSFNNTSQLWKLDPMCMMMTHRLHLPFRIELYVAQMYALQMVMKQQKNRDSFLHMIKTGGTHNSPKSPLDNIVLYLITSAMLFSERFPSQSEQMASMWNHITFLLHTLVTYGWCDMSRFLPVLATTLPKCQYRRARGEVMWTILQNITTLKAKERTSESYRMGLQAIAEIYSYLYENEESSVISSDCPLKTVRSLSAACMWIALKGGSESLPPPSSFLARQIDFVSSTNPNNTDPSMLAVYINAYINHDSGESKQAITALLNRLQSEQVFLLNDHRTTSLFPPFEYELLHALGLKGQLTVLTQLLTDMKNTFSTDPSCALPSPAMIETTARLACMIENDKSVGSVFARLVEEANKDGGFRSPQFLFIIMELMTYRCFNQPHNSRINVITAAFQMLYRPRQDNVTEAQMKGPLLASIVHTDYDLYSAIELLVLRLCTWLPPSDSISFVTSMVVKPLMNTKMHVLVDGTPSPPYSDLNFPHDLVKVLFVTYLRSCKLLGHEVHPELLRRINTGYYWASSQTRYLNDKLEPNPPEFSQFESDEFMKYNPSVNSDSIQMRGIPEHGWAEYYLKTTPLLNANMMPPTTNTNTLFSSHFRNVYERNQSTSVSERTAILNILKGMDVPRQITAINSFVDYLAQEAMGTGNVENFAAAACNAIAGMVIVDEVVPIDRFFFTAAFTTRSDESTMAVLSIIRRLVLSPPYVEMTNQLATLPKIGSSDFIKKMNELKTRRRTSHNHSRIHDLQPSYYGHPLLKIISAVDALIEKALQLNIREDHFKDLMDAFTQLYRFHPYPLTYCLSVMNLLYGHTDPRDDHKNVEERSHILKMSRKARLLVTSIVKYEHGQCPFSPQFVNCNQSIDEGDALDIAFTLTNKLVATFEIGHCPDDSLSSDPVSMPFYTGDWRSSELSPQGHALYAIACEMLASPLSNQILGRAFIDVLYQETLDRPLLYLNAVSLILTALPYTYSDFLFDDIMGLFGDPIEHLSIDQIIMETYEKVANRRRATRVHAIVALSQAFWHHATNPILIHFATRFEEELERGVNTEKDLFLALHILIPLLQRIADAKEKSSIDRCFRMVVLIYRLLQKIAVNEITKEDAICDLLYHFKYMFVGDFVKKDINEIIDSMSDSLKRKLKFIVQSTERGTNEDHDTSERKDSIM